MNWHHEEILPPLEKIIQKNKACIQDWKKLPLGQNDQLLDVLPLLLQLE